MSSCERHASGDPSNASYRLALPFSIVGTFTVIYVLGYSLDNLSLMALTLSVGFIVDDAIVMLENIVRHMEMGKPRLQAALDGSKEIAFTIVSMTVSLAAVLIPVYFMGGVVGRLMHEFAVTITAAILVSGLVSLTLTLMLGSRFLKAPHEIRHGWFYNVMERGFDAWLRGYSWSLRQAIRFKGVTMVVSALLLAGTVYLFSIIPLGFIPNVDTGQLNGQIAALGLTVDQVELALTSSYGSRQVSQIFAPDDQYQVILQVDPRYQRDPAALSMLYVQGTGGKLVPLSAVVTTRETVGPQSVNHTGQSPSVTLSFNLRPGTALGDAVARVQDVARQTLPDSVTGSFQGTAQAFQESMVGLGWVLVLAIFVIYVVLGILYERFIHPITILSGLPSAGFGALLTLLLFKHDLNIYAFVGVIMLVGLVKKNGIMMIDFAIETRRRAGVSPAEAIYEACRVRFRPIMMTTMAALMGTLPIALGMGAGSEARRPLGLAVVGGLLVSQTLTLYVTPVSCVYMEHFQDWLTTRRKVRQPAVEDGEPAVVELARPAVDRPEIGS